jgi:hypothetical protein
LHSQIGITIIAVLSSFKTKREGFNEDARHLSHFRIFDTAPRPRPPVSNVPFALGDARAAAWCPQAIHSIHLF